ncbi:MAG: DUF2069 domain-containing protein [Parashewanella sp.]
MTTSTLLNLCRIGYIALVLMLGSYFTQQWLNGSYSFVFMLIWILPLLLPLKGVIQGNPYTYAWGSFILCLYLLHALTLLYIADASLSFAIIETLLLTCLTIGFPYYARYRGRELGLGLKKRKRENKL